MPSAAVGGEIGRERGWMRLRKSLSSSSLHSRSVRGDELIFRSSTPIFGSTTKLQHIRLERVGAQWGSH